MGPNLQAASAATALLAVAIAVLALMPVAGDVPGSDKIYHAVAFAALASPLALARAALAVSAALIATAYGATIELLQPLFGRAAEWSDLGADALGAALGAGTAALVGTAWRKRVAGPR